MWPSKKNTEVRKTVQPKIKTALQAIWQAPDKQEAEHAFDGFIEIYEVKYPKATLCLQKDREELFAFYDFPTRHWQSIRTTNPIESSFATIRQCTEKTWRRLKCFGYLAKVIQGTTFNDGIEVKKFNQNVA